MSDKFREIISGRPVILGHRGAPGQAQENSIESFKLALDAGADGIELDVHRTADGVLIVYHDESLSDGRFISGNDFMVVKIAALRQKIMVNTLEEVFRALAGKGYINIELKRAGFERQVLELARALLPKETFLFATFIPEAVAACRKLAPDVPAILIRIEPGEFASELELIREIDASGVAFHHARIESKLAEFFKSHDVPLFTWTVNTVAEAKRMESLGVAGIITDRPEELAGCFGSEGMRMK